MQIATLTFHNAVNYGAVLQAYALAAALKKTGGADTSVGILDYHNESIEAKFRPLYIEKKRGIKKQVIALLRMLTMIDLKAKRLKKFRGFLDSRCGLIPFSTEEEKRAALERTDLFVVGSDQVWNFDITGGDDTYMLSFLSDPDKKASYAASIGKTELSDRESEALRKVGDFRYLSARENTAGKLVEDLTGSPVTIVPDPVFLLTREQWREAEKAYPTGLEGQDYILIYHFNGGEEMFRFAGKLSEKHGGCPILCIQGSKKKRDGVTVINDASPDQFVWLIDHARCVVTNSFHGTAFSVIFGKDFYSEVNISRATRIRELLAHFGLEARQLFGGVLSEEPAPFDAETEKRVEEYRNVGLDYIRRMVNNE